MKVKIYLSAFIIACLMHACILNNEDDEFTLVEQIPNYSHKAILSPSGQINEDHDAVAYPAYDTVWVDEFLIFRLKESRPYTYEIFIDGKKVGREDDNYEFYISRHGKYDSGIQLDDGIYRMTVVQMVPSGTGSLSDKLNAEYVSYSDDYILVIGDHPYDPQIEAFIEDGRLSLSWSPPYPHGDFQRYKIQKFVPGSNYRFTELERADKAQTSVIDHTYLGKAIKFQFVVDVGGYSWEYPFYLNLSEEADIVLTLKKVGDRRYKLSWNKPLFYNNIEYYSLANRYTTVVEKIPPENTSVEFIYHDIGEESYFVFTVHSNGLQSEDLEFSGYIPVEE